MWAIAIAGVTLVIGVVLPFLARVQNERLLPPDAVRFGSASVQIPEGWLTENEYDTSITVTYGDLWVTFVDAEAMAGSEAVDGPEAVDSPEAIDRPEARVIGLSAEMMAGYPQLTAASAPREFTTDAGRDGWLQAIAGVADTALVAVLPAEERMIEMTSLGSDREVSLHLDDIDAMLASVRVHGGDP